MSNLLNINADEIVTLFRKHFPDLPENMEESVNAILVTEPPQEVNAEITLSGQGEDHLVNCQILEGYNNTCTSKAVPAIFPLQLASTGTLTSADYPGLFQDTACFYLAANLALTGVLFYDEAKRQLLGLYTGSAIASDDSVSFVLAGGWHSNTAD
ncbi:MAG TPA: hypothetical protein DEF05_04195 [Erwinia sp.]|uniref:hypothetical protein n=1 Tax=Erwinia citreus TaxID=558 RepID=UPI000E969870|nr:hypothetical protein [Erwinia sp.]HBV38898.1 hypothetical protein [Erwinia sp.]